MKVKRTIPLSVAVLISGALLVLLAPVFASGDGATYVTGVLTAPAVAVMVVAAFRVVRALERSEERLRVIVEIASDGIITTNEFGIIESVNASATTLFGYRPGMLIGEDISILLASAPVERTEGESFRTCLERQQVGALGIPHEVQGLRQDGRRFPMELSVNEASLAGESFFTVMVRDITERAASQQMIRESKDELERRVKERTTALEESNFRLHGEIARRKALIQELQAAVKENKTLSGLLPICASCKKICDDQGCWHPIEVFIRDHSDADFSHGICPDCVRQLYPDLREPVSES